MAAGVDIETLKREVGGLEVWSHIVEASKIGFEAVDQKLVPLFKWYGVYAQKPNADGYFMMRIKIPGGQLNAEQVETLAKIGTKYGRGIVDITTRQAVQIHWARIENIPEILETLARVGMDTAGGCGDITRNITGNPLAGLDPDELFDATPELIAIDNFFTRNPDFSNLPRKYKLSVSASKTWISQPDINCASLVGVEHNGELGYTLKIGGGLSTKPMIAKNFPVFIKRTQALDVMKAVTTVYRDHGFREKRQNARIKFLVDVWGVEKFLEETEKVLGYKLERVTEIGVSRATETGTKHELKQYYAAPDTSHGDHLGVIKLNNGNYAVGIAFISGRTRSEDLEHIAGLLRRYGGTVRTTNKQNLIIVNVPAARVEEMVTEANKLGLKVEHSTFSRLGVACTGTEFCNLAIVETKARARDLFDYLDREFPGLQEQLMISVTGCPNNCAQYAVADIGIVGAKVKTSDGTMQDAFRIFLGGRLGKDAQFGKPLEGRFLHSEIQVTLAKILRKYLSERSGQEEFRNYIDRVGLAEMQAEVQDMVPVA